MTPNERLAFYRQLRADIEADMPMPLDEVTFQLYHNAGDKILEILEETRG
jgi:hypothetical protein